MAQKKLQVGVIYKVYSARVIDLTSPTVGTPLADTAEGGIMCCCLETCVILVILIHNAISSVDIEINTDYRQRSINYTVQGKNYSSVENHSCNV
jgi:hypothetical protein